MDGDLYGRGERGVVPAHGGRFDNESWEKQARALAIDFRGFGQADPLNAPLHFDVLGAVRYLRKTGATGVSFVGEPGEIDRVVLVSGGSYTLGGKLKRRKLYIVSRADIGRGSTAPVEDSGAVRESLRSERVGDSGKIGTARDTAIWYVVD